MNLYYWNKSKGQHPLPSSCICVQSIRLEVAQLSLKLRHPFLCCFAFAVGDFEFILIRFYFFLIFITFSYISFDFALVVSTLNYLLFVFRARACSQQEKKKYVDEIYKYSWSSRSSSSSRTPSSSQVFFFVLFFSPGLCTGPVFGFRASGSDSAESDSGPRFVVIVQR